MEEVLEEIKFLVENLDLDQDSPEPIVETLLTLGGLAEELEYLTMADD